jgi:hypothetical protein
VMSDSGIRSVSQPAQQQQETPETKREQNPVMAPTLVFAAPAHSPILAFGSSETPSLPSANPVLTSAHLVDTALTD